MFRDIIGHEGPLSLLKRAAFTGRIPNAYLFVGPPHVGRRTAALQLAKALNCERNTSFASADAVDSATTASTAGPSTRSATRT